MLSVRGGGGDSENLKSLSLGPTGRRTPFLAVSWLKDTPPGGGAVGDWTPTPVRSEAASADDIADLGVLSQTRTRRGPHPAEGAVPQQGIGPGLGS